MTEEKIRELQSRIETLEGRDEEKIRELQSRIETLEGRDDEWKFRHLVEKALHDSTIFRMGKWIALSVATLLVITIFGGAILGSNQIKSLEQQAASAEKQIAEKRTETEAAINKELEEVLAEAESFKYLLGKQDVLVKAKATLQVSLSRVQELSDEYSEEIESAKNDALEKLDVSNVQELKDFAESIKDLEDRAKFLENKDELRSIEGLHILFGNLLWVFLALSVSGPLIGVGAVFYAWSRTRRNSPNKANPSDAPKTAADLQR